MRSLAAISLAVALGLTAHPRGLAQELVAPIAAASRPWASLRPDQQLVLKALGPQWRQLDATDQEKWLQVAARYPKLQAAEQQRVQARMTEWAQMSPTQRTQVRIGWQEAQRVTADERQAKWERYQALSAEQRELLKLRASQRHQRITKTATAQPLTPLMTQARAGASTVTSGSRSAPSLMQPLPLARLDPQTLLPKSPAAPAP